MKITIRLIVSLVIVVALVALAFSLYQVNRERDLLARDLERRAVILAESFQESLAPLIQSGAGSRLNRIVNRFGNRERLKGIIFDRQGGVITATSSLILDAKDFSPSSRYDPRKPVHWQFRDHRWTTAICLHDPGGGRRQ